MQVFKNRFYFGRNYECTNIVACRAPAVPTCIEHGVKVTDSRWIPADETILKGLTMLWRNGDVEMYGYL